MGDHDSIHACFSPAAGRDLLIPATGRGGALGSEALGLLLPTSCPCLSICRATCAAEDTQKYLHLLFPGNRFLLQTQDSNLHLLRQCLGRPTTVGLPKPDRNQTLKFILIRCKRLSQKEKFLNREGHLSVHLVYCYRCLKKLRET